MKRSLRNIFALVLAAVICMQCLSVAFAAALLGDVNGDGKIDAGDARGVLRIAVGLDSADEALKAIADVDGDGKVTAGDARWTLRVAVGLEKERTIELEIQERINFYEVFVADSLSWKEAEQYCESLGGHLATVTSQKENDYVYQFIKDAGYESAYFGLTDEDVEGTWIWVTGEPLSYTNWHPGEPNRQNNGEDYAMFYSKFSDGTWNDGDFEYKIVAGGIAFICEWETEEAYNAYLEAKEA